MTTLTRCPQCLTAFRITTEQLMARQGDVRCGQCAKVFNALDRLVTPADHEAPAAVDDGVGADDTRNFDLFGAARTYSAETEAASAATRAPEPPVAGSLLAPRPDGGRRARTWPFVVGAALAAFALAGQAGWHFRNEIAAQYPQARPWLDAFCAEAGCVIVPPVDARAISIEASDLQADPAHRALLVLTAVLRNRATYAQPTPLLELSLTDAGDVPLARRVLRPADYASESATIGAGAELQLRLTVDAGQVRASGYRLYAFYP